MASGLDLRRLELRLLGARHRARLLLHKRQDLEDPDKPHRTCPCSRHQGMCALAQVRTNGNEPVAIVDEPARTHGTHANAQMCGERANAACVRTSLRTSA